MDWASGLKGMIGSQSSLVRSEYHHYSYKNNIKKLKVVIINATRLRSRNINFLCKE